MKLSTRKRSYFGWRKQKQWIVGCLLLSITLFSMLLFPESLDHPSQTWVFLGKFHPVFLHLPIGMLVIVLLMEVQAALRDKKSHASMPLTMATLSALVAVFFGYIQMKSGDYPTDAIKMHLWTGVFFSVTLVWSLFFKMRYNASGRGQRMYWFLLMLSAFLMVVAGHYGGVMTHGDIWEKTPW